MNRVLTGMAFQGKSVLEEKIEAFNLIRGKST